MSQKELAKLELLIIFLLGSYSILLVDAMRSPGE